MWIKKGQPTVNAISVIFPYKYLGLWVFDDEKTGLIQEPFVAGADTLIDRALAAKGINGENYIIGGENIDYDGLFKKIKTLTKSNISIIKVNYNFIKIVIGFISKLNTLLGFNPPITPKVLESLFTNRPATSKKAISSMNYKITPLIRGLDQTIKYLN